MVCNGYGILEAVQKNLGIESGNTDDALTDAEALILSAERPHAEKAAAAARIRALYAHLDP